ncbi:MAG TPA: membrane protein insertion efficiency factor YidD [Elusimicrobiota bacterium]|jgi:putative membrane protein insertion efficiency factor|nr:membrane protein insertion efficiency factor YidD [Elusimicrobiota bacterium]
MKSKLLSALFNLYRGAASALWPACCRFEPSCSRYAEESLRAHGALRGAALTFARLARCGPFHPGGHDPVPGKA